MAHFQTKDLSFSYPTAKDQKSLDDVNLFVKKGEYIVLCGKSGSGKTTLLRQLKSVLAPHGKKNGEILFNGTPIERVSQRDQSAKIGYVMQNPDDQIVTDTPRCFFGNNSFYTTAANRMSRHVFDMAMTAENVVGMCRQNKEAKV